ncbi:MAG: gliding motility-associated C-terminal domain-containing protein, partial [Flavobacteriia bacterium]|nr:gliding motility-associated C-terminal domain-containing protein [Flavobacteriia bacterium]
CVGTPVHFVVTVNPIPTVTNATTTQTICSGSLASITPTSAVANTTFGWTASASAGTITGYTTPGTGNISETLTNSASTSGTVTYVVTPTGPAPTSCVGTPVNFVVTVNVLSNPSFTFADFCQGASNSPIITGDLGGTFAFNPAVSDGATINTNTGVISNGVGGTQYAVEYSTAGCPNSMIVNVNVKIIPNAPSISGLPTGVECVNWPSSVLTANGSGGTFVWSDQFNTVVSNTNTFTPPHLLGANNYSIIETLANCPSLPTLISIVYQNCDIIVPTAFTPDNNNVDDFWEIANIDEIFPNNQIVVYNRWGALLYKSDKGNYNGRPWNGKFNDEDLPVASYYFIIEYNDNKTENLTGTVSIIKK